MKILITGGTGLIGSRLRQKLKEKGFDVFAPSSKELDITKKIDLKDHYDIVFHLAAVLDEKSPLLWKVNVEGTENIVKNVSFDKFVYLSSIGVLGYGENLKPSSDYNPQTPYEKTKMESEKIIKRYCGDYLIIRCPVIIGPNKYWEKIFEYVKKGFPLIGTGNNIFPLTYYKEVVDLLSNEKYFYNLSGVYHFVQFQRTYKEVYECLRVVVGKDRYKYIKLPKYIVINLAKILSLIKKDSILKPEHVIRLTCSRRSVENLCYDFKYKDLIDCLRETYFDLSSKNYINKN